MGASTVHLVLETSHSLAICILPYLFAHRYFHHINEGSGGSRIIGDACIRALSLCSVFYPILLLSPKSPMQIKQSGCNFFKSCERVSQFITPQADLGWILSVGFPNLATVQTCPKLFEIPNFTQLTNKPTYKSSHKMIQNHLLEV